MSAELAEVITRLDSVRQLRAVVTTLRGIAAARAQEGRAKLVGIRAYAEVVSAALAAAAGLLPDTDAPPARGRTVGQRGIVLFCAEHGFAGAFSERVLEAALGLVADAALFVVGSRGVIAAEECRIRPALSIPMASHAGAVTITARRVAEALYDRFIAARLDRVDIILMRSDPGRRPAIEARQLLPLDLGRFRSTHPSRLPMTYLRPELLIEKLVGEYFFAELVDAAMESFASENAARLETMSAARRNIDEVLDRLMARERQLRQEAITAELLDIVAGDPAIALRH
jgi:F-type H+-transporting ATPase subunit gamma